MQRNIGILTATLLTATLAGLFLAAPRADAQGVLTERNVSLAMAMTIAQAALETCRAEGDKVTVAIVDRTGQLKFLLKDDGASPHTLENAQKKAFTARTFQGPSQNLADALAKGPIPQVHLTGITASGGGLPIKFAGSDTIGGAAVSGSPSKNGVNGGVRDAKCVQAGLDKVADQLK